jgi:acyl-CoA synthetase (AMP-forming)/AMP-acid ligase II
MKFKKEIEILYKSKTLGDVLKNIAIENKAKIFLVDPSNKISLTYEDFDKLVNQCCFYLSKFKLKKEHIITLYLDNSYEFLIFYFSCLRLRITVNPLPHNIGEELVTNTLKIIKPRILISNTHIKNNIKKNFINTKFINIAKLDLITYLKKQNKKFKKFNNKIATIYFSSGTTGNQKLIKYSHFAMLQNQIFLIKSGFSKKKPVHLCFLPLGHTSALRYTIKHCVSLGGTIILYKSFWSVRENLFSETLKYKANYFQTVPTILNAILLTKYKSSPGKDLKNNFIGCGSAYLDKNIQNKFEKKYKIKVSNLYGLSEVGCSNFDNIFKKRRILGSIGNPLFGVKIRILNNKDQFAKKNEKGEILIKGNNLFSGYYKNSILTKKSFYKNYFKTGDIGYYDKNKFYYYLDRSKDIIIKGGVNVYPSDIEEIILKSNYISEVAIKGYKEKFFGEKIACFFVPNNKFNMIKFVNYCKKKIGRIQFPDKFIPVKLIPKTISGKIVKRKLIIK